MKKFTYDEDAFFMYTMCDERAEGYEDINLKVFWQNAADQFFWNYIQIKLKEDNLRYETLMRLHDECITRAVSTRSLFLPLYFRSAARSFKRKALSLSITHN